MDIETPPLDHKRLEQPAERRGLVLVHTGDGKGKSTAAFGLAMRAHGRGKSVRIFQFMKVPSARFGEHRALEQLGIAIEGVADVPSLSVTNASGFEDSAIGLNLQSALTDMDGSETLSLTISGVPTGALLSAGTDNGNPHGRSLLWTIWRASRAASGTRRKSRMTPRAASSPRARATQRLGRIHPVRLLIGRRSSVSG